MEYFIKHLSKFMNDKRLKHSIGVSETSVYLASKYFGIDDKKNIEKAYIAGLLHDSAKEIKIEDYSKFGIDIKKIPKFDFYKQNAPKVLHSFASEQFAKIEFSIKDKEILWAIRSHTMGNQNMTVLDKIIFVADFIEPNRNIDEFADIRKASDKDLDKAVRLGLANILKYLIDNNLFVCVETIKTWNKMARL